MKLFFSKSILIFLLLLTFLWVNSAEIRAQEISLETISISNGLASPNVRALIQDDYGLIWLGTANGIQSYDGFTWKTYRNIIGDTTSLQQNTVTDIAKDSLQNLWIGNELGATYYDRAKNIFKNYNFDSIFQTAGLGRTPSVLVDSDGRVWAGTLGFGILRFDPEKDTWVMAPYTQINGREAVHSEFARLVYEDRIGGIWGASTEHGLLHLAKGSELFVPIKFPEGNEFNSLENLITAFYSDQDGILWFTSRKGIYKYNPATNDLKTIVEYDYLNGDVSTFFNSIKEDYEGNIWIMNNMRGVYKFKGNTDQYEEVIIPGNRRVNSGGWTIRFTQLIMDRSGIFWFGSLTDGLFKYDPLSQPFKFYTHDPQNNKTISSGGAFGLYASKINPGKVFMGTRGNGINVLNESDGSIQKVAFNSANDMFGGSARAIYEQADGTLWIGTWGDGLIKMDQNYNEIKRYKRDALSQEKGLPNDQVRVIREDKTGKIWVGTNGGLTVFDPKTESFDEIVSQYAQTYSDEIISQIKTWLVEDKEIASIERVGQSEELTQGFEIAERGTYFLVTVGEGDPASMADYGWLQNSTGETVVGIESIDDTFWAGGSPKNRLQITQIELNPGTYSLRYSSDDSHHYNDFNAAEPDLLPLYGIAIFKQEADIRSESTVVNVNEQNAEIIIQDSNISDIEMGEKYIWVASINAGVTRIDPATNSTKYYTSDPSDPSTLSDKQVFDVLEKDGQLWMATYGGINILDIEADELSYFTEQDGLPTNFIETVLPGENGEMWFSTQNGLIQMMQNEALDKVTFINYNEDDGIGGESFLSLAADKTPDGNFYFGGDHGLTTFSTITSNKVPPSVIFSNLLISNQSVYDMKENSPLEVDLLATKEVKLKHDQNDLSFEFAALHYANPSKNQYAHMMEGLDQDWIYDNRNFAAYTNLEPGTYTFKVIASNAYGVWNEVPKSIIVTILPPWWKTWWAYSFYALLLVMIGFVSYSGLKRRIRMKERAQSLEREVAQAKEIEKAYTELKATQSQLIQAEKMASLGELTAGIAHEIQNPLNFVNNFSEVSEELIDEMHEELDNGNIEDAKEISKDLKENLTKIKHHGKRADSIVKGMLEHSRGSSSDKKPTNLNALADEFLRLSYHGLRAKDKSFSADFETDLDSNIPRVKAVSQDIGRVFLNLINNAFYACAERKKSVIPGDEQNADSYKPKVSVQSRLVDLGGIGGVEICVKDNGGGIPKSIIDKIFQPFFTTKPTGSGTGLGLSLSYDIIKAHGGDLRVKSIEGEGTEMIIYLPIDSDFKSGSK
ncbi:sensor histidine kinase [Algoriphagus formosus]|uniref:sensor histidine kinase n=1 Tax=Algoriphagus formosus TaxID=2007308 RepID=UPI000C28848E|nr:two-component regulator propeller domain-containing protein [Algoriphagus formosus]